MANSTQPSRPDKATKAQGNPVESIKVVLILHVDEYGYKDFREIGKLSSMLPAYVRQCCRSLHDGTDDMVLDCYRIAAISALKPYTQDYPFVKDHIATLKMSSPEDIKKIIVSNKSGLASCLAINTPNGLPKRACLHCPKVGLWMRILREVKEWD